MSDTPRALASRLEEAKRLVEALRLQVRYAYETQDQAAIRNIRERQQAADLIEILIEALLSQGEQNHE